MGGKFDLATLSCRDAVKAEHPGLTIGGIAKEISRR